MARVIRLFTQLSKKIQQELSEQYNNEELRQKPAIVQGAVTRLEMKTQKLEERIAYLTNQSMRDSLIFKNIPEKRGENVETLQEIMKELKLDDTMLNIYRQIGDIDPGGLCLAEQETLLPSSNQKGNQQFRETLKNLK